jgi:hypothetical protein
LAMRDAFGAAAAAIFAVGKRDMAPGNIACPKGCLFAYAMLSSTMDHCQYPTLHPKRKSIARRRILSGAHQSQDPRSRTLLIAVPAHHLWPSLPAPVAPLGKALSKSSQRPAGFIPLSASVCYSNHVGGLSHACLHTTSPSEATNEGFTINPGGALSPHSSQTQCRER